MTMAIPSRWNMVVVSSEITSVSAYRRCPNVLQLASYLVVQILSLMTTS
jgi:hypothetical protein